MPLLLTTPISTGDLDPGAPTYGEARIVRFVNNNLSSMFELTVQEGNTVDSVWVPGIVGPKRYIIKNMVDSEGNPIPGEQHYTDMVLKTMDDAGLTATDRVYDGVAYHLYSWLVAQGYYDGTYV